MNPLVAESGWKYSAFMNQMNADYILWSLKVPYSVLYHISPYVITKGYGFGFGS